MTADCYRGKTRIFERDGVYIGLDIYHDGGAMLYAPRIHQRPELWLALFNWRVASRADQRAAICKAFESARGAK